MLRAKTCQEENEKNTEKNNNLVPVYFLKNFLIWKIAAFETVL